VTRLVAERLPRSALLDGDELNRMSGPLAPRRIMLVVLAPGIDAAGQTADRMVREGGWCHFPVRRRLLRTYNAPGLPSPAVRRSTSNRVVAAIRSLSLA
jgi:hypothetical protein